MASIPHTSSFLPFPPPAQSVSSEFILLALLVLAQACTLALQERLGPAFFLPRRVARARPYDYHPPLPLNSLYPMGLPMSQPKYALFGVRLSTWQRR